MPTIELTTTRYADGPAAPWAPLIPAPLFIADARSGRYRTAFAPAAAPLLGTGVFQLIPPGMPLRLWLAGDGTTTLSARVETIFPFGAGSAVAAAPILVRTVSASYRMRIGDREGWDNAASFPVSAPPALPDKGWHHSHDPLKVARQQAALAWTEAWGDTLLHFAPKGPIIVLGTVIGGPYDGLPTTTASERQAFLLEECYLVAEQRWLGFAELLTLPLPALGAVALPTTTAAATQAALATLVVPAASTLRPIAAARIVLRPASGNDPTRFAADRSLLPS